MVSNSTVVVVSLDQLDSAYKKETDVDIKERLLLVRRIRFDNLEASKVAEKELSRTRWWAYKWLKRVNEYVLEGLRDHPRSGRPLKVSEKMMFQIRQKMIDHHSGWEVKQIMNLIYEKTGIK